MSTVVAARATAPFRPVDTPRRLSASVVLLRSTGPMAMALAALSVGTATASMGVVLTLGSNIGALAALRSGTPLVDDSRALAALLVLGVLAACVFIALSTRALLEGSRSQLALLRLLGASAADILRAAATVSAVLGLLGAAVGTAIGAGLLPGLSLWLTYISHPLDSALALSWQNAALAAALTVFTAVAQGAACARSAQRRRQLTEIGAAGQARVAPRIVWGLAVVVLGLEAITAGSQQWFAGAEITLIFGTAVLLVGLVILSPALLNLTARVAGLALRLVPKPFGLVTTANFLRDSKFGVTAAGTAMLAVTLTVGLTVVIHSQPIDSGRALDGQMTSALYALLGASAILGTIQILVVSVLSTADQSGMFRALRLAGMQRLAVATTAALSALIIGAYAVALGTATGVGLAAAMTVYISPSGLQGFSVPASAIAIIGAWTVATCVGAMAATALWTTRRPAAQPAPAR